MLVRGARHFVESHFVGTTFGRIRLLVDVTFRRVQHSVDSRKKYPGTTFRRNGQLNYFITNHLRNQFTVTMQ